MSDGVAITAGTGTTIATDDVGSVHYQKVKLDAGGDGASTPILAGGGVEASALRVTIASDSTGVVSVDDNGGALTVDGTVAITAAALPLPSGAATSALQGGGLPAALGAGGGLKIDGSGTALPISGSVTVTSGTRIVSGSVTRPADTNAYQAGDAVTTSTSAPAAITFSGCATANGGTGTIYGVQCIDSANQATKPQLELWVFAGTAAPTPDNDNAVYTPTDAELANLVAVFEFNAWYVGDATAGAGGNCVARALNQNVGFDCGASVADLYGLAVVRNAYTPVSQEALTFILHIGAD